jgi:hypothetical protein
MDVQITGTTTITSFGANYNGPRFVRFAAALTLTHNASTLILPGGANITTAAGDTCLLVPTGNSASGWRVLAYVRAALAPGLAASLSTGRTISLTGDVTATTAAFDGSGNVSGAATIANNAVTTAKIADANITPAKLSGAQSGSAPAYAARAWVNFNGTGTVAIRASGNVSSITDNGVGDYTVNFTTAMQDADFCVAGACQYASDNVSNPGTWFGIRRTTGALSASSVRVESIAITAGAAAFYDSAVMAVSIFR